MIFVIMVHEMRVGFSKNALVIKVVVDNDDHIPSNSQNSPEKFKRYDESDGKKLINSEG